MKILYECQFCGMITKYDPKKCDICGSEDFVTEQTKESNADRVRNMTDNELAEFLYSVKVGAWYPDDGSSDWLKKTN